MVISKAIKELKTVDNDWSNQMKMTEVIKAYKDLHVALLTESYGMDLRLEESPSGTSYYKDDKLVCFLGSSQPIEECTYVSPYGFEIDSKGVLREKMGCLN